MMGAPDGNKNAEIWTIEKATELFDTALEMSKKAEYDFIGEIARDLDVSRNIFEYLANKYPSLKDVNDRLLSNLEANCFMHSKNGKIREATAIVNLKSNYGWTDRQQLGVTGNVELRFDKDDAHA